MTIQVFLSYHRASSEWIAYSIREKLVSKGVDVFFDIEDINSGRFKNVICNEIAKRAVFIVIISPESYERFTSEQDWVRREVELALELKKNVIPVLINGAEISRIPQTFPNREALVSLNALNVSFYFFDEAMDILYNRYLTNPTIQEIEFQIAEEHYQNAMDAQQREDWKVAEIEYEKAAARRRRAEYLLGLGAAKHRQGRNLEALKDLDAAISIDPFAWDLMNAKFKVLQDIDRMQDAINLPDQWKDQAERTANSYASRVLAGVESGLDLPDSVKKIPELTSLYDHMPVFGMVAACVETLREHISGKLEENLISSWHEWMQHNEATRADYVKWKSLHEDFSEKPI
jgi:tetratricopeptide (TPR) repeat protein